MKKHLTIIIGIFAMLILAGCAQSVEEVSTEENIGETVSVKGTVESTLKIGDLSGYTLVDDNGDEIRVASERLPAEGDVITAKGVLNKGLFGYYINVDEE